MGRRHAASAALCGVAFFGAGLSTAPWAAAEQPNIPGVITADEAREISADGPRICGTLLRSASTAPLTPEDAALLIDDYLNQGWDLESTADILQTSVDRTCGQFLPQVSRALTAYGPVS